jgi:hypothetical protein
VNVRVGRHDDGRRPLGGHVDVGGSRSSNGHDRARQGVQHRTLKVTLAARRDATTDGGGDEQLPPRQPRQRHAVHLHRQQLSH